MDINITTKTKAIRYSQYIYISRIFNESLVTLTVLRSELSRSMQLNPINFDRAYASLLTIRPLYKEIILVIGVGGGSHVFR